MFNWVAGFIALLIVMAFFWPQSNKSPADHIANIEKASVTNKSNDIKSLDRGNSFSRPDDRTRSQNYKDIEAYDQKIRVLVNEAQKLVEAQSYTLPKERNAILVYQEILTLSPNNSSAKQGIDNVATKLLNIGRRALNNDKLSTANRSLQKLLDIDQESEQTVTLTGAISSWHEGKKQAAFAQKIFNLITQGNLAFSRQELIAPATKNALYYYEQVLVLDPKNTKAVSGINQVINVYRQSIQNAINRQDYSNASTNLEILIEIDRNDPSIDQFKDTITQAQQTLEAAELESSE